MQIEAFHLRSSITTFCQPFPGINYRFYTKITSQAFQEIYEVLIESKRDLKYSPTPGKYDTLSQIKFSQSFQWLSDGDINELISSLFRLVVRGSMIWRVHAPLADRF